MIVATSCCREGQPNIRLIGYTRVFFYPHTFAMRWLVYDNILRVLWRIILKDTAVYFLERSNVIISKSC